MPPSVGVETFESIQDQWESLLASCPTNTVFITPWWQSVWWSHFGGDAELWILSVRDANRSLGIAPLMRRDGVVTFVGDTDLCDFNDFVVPRGSESPFFDVLCDYLAAAEWHTLDLRSLSHDSPALSYVPELARRKGFSVEVREEDMTPVVALPPTWDEYVAGLGKKERHELRRKLRRLDEGGEARQYECGDPPTHPDCMDHFFRLLRASRADKKKFLTSERERFFVDIAIELSARGQFRLSFLELDDVRVASCINFDYGDSYLLYNSGYDPSYAGLSVGLLNKALTLKEAITAGKKYFNFLRGTERYKYDLGGKNQPVYQLIVRR